MFGVSRVTRLSSVRPSAGLLLSQPGHAQSALNMIRHCGRAVDVNVHSIRDLRYNHIVSQRYDYSCGRPRSPRC